MKYCILPTYVWTYPDIHEYPEAKGVPSLTALRGGYAAFQIHLYETAGEAVTVSCQGFSAELYRQIPIFVESCPGIETPIPHFPERKAPFFVNDCLCPIDAEAPCGEESTGIYVAIPVAVDSKEMLEGSVTISDGSSTVVIPVAVNVLKAPLPEETLEIAMGISYPEMIKYHGVKSRDEFERLQTQYLSLLRRQHQTRLYVTPPRERRVGGKWTFDFTDFNAYVKKALGLGFRSFNIDGVGFRRAWDAPDILHYGLDLLSWEGYIYLTEYLTALRENLRQEGWLNKDIFFLGVSDEPNEENAMTYRALVSVIRKLIPEIKLYDATSGAPIYGTLDIWIPRSDEYEKNREMFDHYKESGDSVWHYVCLYPREGGYINRFMDIPLLCTRYLYWGNYHYGLTGYLHWTVNCYQAGADPFKSSCPRHVNAGSESILPPGDDKLIYPGDGRGWMSIRLENHRESAEEYAMLAAIAKKDKHLADSICDSVFESFSRVELDSEKFEAAHLRLMKEYEKLFEEAWDPADFGA
ncbi:MAG: DUF4091 domain-containing protein [Clostridia bacterium]|nr:DUF4091 domain-containing protein [Clostridia bacterium]